eukprot:SAG25_NODE_8855_length_400_cov_1.368771_1_plen_47_part_10
MKEAAAFLLAQMGGGSADLAAMKKICAAVEIEIDEEKAGKLLEGMEG